MIFFFFYSVRFMISGSAPISGEVIDFLRVVFGCQVVEGKKCF